MRVIASSSSLSRDFVGAKLSVTAEVWNKCEPRKASRVEDVSYSSNTQRLHMKGPRLEWHQGTINTAPLTTCIVHSGDPLSRLREVMHGLPRMKGLIQQFSSIFSTVSEDRSDRHFTDTSNTHVYILHCSISQWLSSPLLQCYFLGPMDPSLPISFIYSHLHF
jgi:hypothetical protein